MGETLGEIEQFLAGPDPLVAVWQTWPSDDGEGLEIFAVHGRQTERLGGLVVPAAERAAIDERLRKRGVQLAKCGLMGEHFWSAGKESFSLWSKGSLAVEGRNARLAFADGRTIAGGEIAAVVSFVDQYWVRRGVRLDLVDGSKVEIGGSTTGQPLVDPSYGRNDLLAESGWARHLGRELASWLGVPHRDEISDAPGPTPVAPSDIRSILGTAEK